MEPGPLPLEDDEDADTAVVAAFLAGAGGLASVDQDAPTGVILETAPESRKSPTSVSLACSNGLDDDDLLSGLL